MSGRRRGRSAEGSEEVDQSWLMTYGDMVTLLMAFFVMLFAVSSVEQDKFEAFLSGLGQFNNPSADPIGLGEPSGPVIPAVLEESLPEEQPPVMEGGLPPSLEALGQEIVAAVAAAGHAGAVEITEDERGLNVSIRTDRVLFENGSAQLTPQGAQIIAALAPPLGRVSNQVRLEGHADTTPLNRNGYTNWNLSTDRAVAVVNQLVAVHGLPPHRLSATGFGEFHPRDPGATPEAKARNRRVELIVVHDPG